MKDQRIPEDLANITGLNFDVQSYSDRDLSPINRTEANYYKMLYLEAVSEVRKAHKGIKRLKRYNTIMRERLAEHNIPYIRPGKGKPEEGKG